MDYTEDFRKYSNGFNFKYKSVFSINHFSLGWNAIGYGFYLMEENEFTVNLCV